MTGIELLKAERAIYYAALNVLTNEGIPRDVWPLVMDSAAGRVKDESLTYISMQALAAEDKSRQTDDEKEASDGEHPARD
jgi:hypothetical protein